VYLLLQLESRNTVRELDRFSSNTLVNAGICQPQWLVLAPKTLVESPTDGPYHALQLHGAGPRAL
jgi:hypothetical protein